MSSFILILFCIAFVGFIVFSIWYNSPEQKGKRGEMRIHEILLQMPGDYHMMDDIVLKTNIGTTQIDHVVVSKYGIFVIETKNYRGEIYGDDNRQQWTQIIVTDVTYRKKWYKTYTYVTKNHFYNPVKQSIGHLYEIKKILSEWPHLKIIPIVVFAGTANLSNVKSNKHVIYDNNLIATIQNYRTVYLSDSDVQSVINRISEKNMRNIIDNTTHVRNVYAAKNNYKRKLASGICPKCGGKLVLRSGKFGNFYGCSNYPNCNFTTH